jgi:hypothetical protein
MPPRSSARTHARRRRLGHERRPAAEVLGQFDGVNCSHLGRANDDRTIGTLRC